MNYYTIFLYTYKFIYIPKILFVSPEIKTYYSPELFRKSSKEKDICELYF